MTEPPSNRAVVYTHGGPPDVLHLVTRPAARPGPGEVRVRIAYTGVNPIDVKERQRAQEGPAVIPHFDAAGVVDAVGPDVTGRAPGDRVWVWLDSAGVTGTAQDYLVLPARFTVALPDGVPLEWGACLGVPAVTAHRALTTFEGAPARLAPGALAGLTVLVAGGTGAVGNSAVQLAHWAGAHVVATVGTAAKAALARAAGADSAVIREGDITAAVADAAPAGYDVIVEVAPAENAALDAAVAKIGCCLACYNRFADEGAFNLRVAMAKNLRYQWIRILQLPEPVNQAAVGAVADAVAAGAWRAGEAGGLPLHVYPLDDVAAAHAALEDGVTGKVLLQLA